MLDEVRRQGEWENWLDFFLEGVELTANNVVETAKRFVDCFREDEKVLLKTGRGKGSLAQVHQVLCSHPLVNIKTIQAHTGLSFPAASKALDKLQTLEIVDEMTGKKRNRLYRYTKYIEILNERTELESGF